MAGSAQVGSPAGGLWTHDSDAGEEATEVMPISAEPDVSAAGRAVPTAAGNPGDADSADVVPRP